MNIGMNIDFVKGLLFGIRHFDPDEYHPYLEVQLYILFIRINIFIFSKS
jgi:hypothetical protein